MKLQRTLIAGLALAVATAFSFHAIAEESKPAPAPAAAAKPAAPAAATPAKPAKPRVEVKAEVTGKLALEKKTNKKTGKEVEVPVLTVASAKAADGKALDGLKGKSLNVAGKKGQNVKSFAGKDVTINGTIVNNQRLEVDTIK